MQTRETAFASKREIRIPIAMPMDVVNPVDREVNYDNHNFYSWKEWKKKTFYDKFKLMDAKYSVFFHGKNYAKMHFHINPQPQERSQFYITWHDCSSKLGYMYELNDTSRYMVMEVLKEKVVFQDYRQSQIDSSKKLKESGKEVSQKQTQTTGN